MWHLILYQIEAQVFVGTVYSMNVVFLVRASKVGIDWHVSCLLMKFFRCATGTNGATRSSSHATFYYDVAKNIKSSNTFTLMHARGMVGRVDIPSHRSSTLIDVFG